jgi:pyridoxine 5-phosphate synthase
MTQLSVNINKIATLRNTRTLNLPNVTHLAQLALDAGAHGITMGARPGPRPRRARARGYPHAEFNIEGNPFHDFMPHIRRIRPTQCTLVPDAIDAFTSNQGWSLTADTCQKLAPLIAEMKSLNCRVSLFMDADSPHLEQAQQLGADRIELYTEPYAAAFQKGGPALEASLTQFAKAAAQATAAGLHLNAGHDLNLANLPPFLARIPPIAEVSIGHALIADALEFGMPATIKKYLAACQ